MRAAILAGCSIVLAGCQTGTVPKVRVWLHEDAHEATGWLHLSKAPPEGTTPERPPTSTTRVNLTAAINETVSFTFVIEPEADAIDRPDFRIKSLLAPTGRIDAPAFSLFRAHHVPAGPIPGWHIRALPPNMRNPAPLDVLVPVRAPRGGLPANLLPGQPYIFWADLAVPKGTFAGTYKGDIELLTDGTLAGRVDIELEVLPFVLPDTDATPLLAAIDHRSLFRHHLRQRGSPYAPPTDDWRADPRREELDQLLRSTMQTMRNHRIMPTLPHFTPIVRVNRYRTFDADWSAFDEIVGPIMNGRFFEDRVPAFAWPLPTTPIAGEAIDVGSREQNMGRSVTEQRIVADYLQKCAAHFEAMGWLDRSFVSMSDAAPQWPTGFPGESAHRANVSMYRRLDVSPRPRTLVHGFPQDMTPYGWIGADEQSERNSTGEPRADNESSYDRSMQNIATTPENDIPADIWAPSAQFYDPAAMHAERAQERKTWLIVDRPPFSGTTELGAPAGCILGLPWQLTKLEAEAGMIGMVNHWPPAADAPTPAACTQLDPRVLLYPGAAFGLDEPVPSIRLKQIRRAMQDAAYATLLHQRDREQIADALLRTLVVYAGTQAYRTSFADGRRIGFALNTEPYQLARRIMADELVDATTGPTSRATSDSDFSRTATWRRLMLTFRSVEPFSEGCRVRLDNSPYTAGHETTVQTNPRLEVDCWIAVVNHTRIPLDGTLRWSHLPRGWSTSVDEVTLPRIAPGRIGRILLSASITAPDALLISGTASRELGFELIESSGRIHAGSARLAWLTAAPRTARITIDGDLSDWPPGRENVASDFRLISGPPPTRSDADRWSTHPRFPTLAFVARDADALYVAIRAARDATKPLLASNTNVVRYDDLIPVGEELVEMLFDPLNAGTRSPSDLYRLVIKPSGTYLAERGLRTNPPCSVRRPWTADIQVATRVHRDYWTTEVRIPLRSLGENGSNLSEVWGFNLTRFDATDQTFSTWSGAVGNAYDPLSLGNLLLPAWPEPPRQP